MTFDNTHTLPPPPLEMIEEAEKENEKYIQELFNRCQTIPTFNKYVNPVLGKKFAHPVAKIMDKLINEYWNHRVVKEEIKEKEREYKKVLEGKTPSYNRNPKNIEKEYNNRYFWYFRKVLGQTHYHFDESWYFIPSDHCKKTEKGMMKQKEKIAAQVSCFKNGKRVMKRENTFIVLLRSLRGRGIYIPLNILEDIMRKNKYKEDKCYLEAEDWYHDSKGIKIQPDGLDLVRRHFGLI